MTSQYYPAEANVSSTTGSNRLMGHEAEIIIPGSFVVLQGTPGDGVANSMDSSPLLPPLRLPVDYHRVVGAAATVSEPLASTSTVITVITDEDEDDFMDAEEDQSSSSSSSSSVFTPAPRTVAQMASQNTTLGGLTAAIGRSVPPRAKAARVKRDASSSSTCNMTDSFVVVSEQQQEDGRTTTNTGETAVPTSAAAAAAATATATASQPKPKNSTTGYRSLSPTAQTAVEEWNRRCRQRELEQKRDWQENVLQTLATTSNTGTAAAAAAAAATTVSHPMQDHLFWRRKYDFWWLTPSNHKIAIFREIPTLLSNTGTILKSVVGSLNPGSTIVATEIVYLDSHTLQRIRMPPRTSTSTAGNNSTTSTVQHCIYPRGKRGWITMVKVEASASTNTVRSGYAVLNIDGYPLLAPGLPSMYTHPDGWIWRVTCPAGAFVREGLDLNTRHLDTIPYGSLVRVTRRTMNSQGLCRLRVSALVEDDNSSGGTSNSAAATTTTPDTAASSLTTTINTAAVAPSPTTRRYSHYHSPTRLIDGWCSEFLNPLSGNRGSVLEPLSFPVPALYQVTLPMGAVVRSGVELSTAQVADDGTTTSSSLIPRGAIVPVIGRAFSEHPVDHCLERLKLANGGWISVRLNRPPPEDDLIVQDRDVDSSFDPETPAIYHWKHTTTATTAAAAAALSSSSDDVRELSSVDSDAVSSIHGSSGELSSSPNECSTSLRSFASPQRNNNNNGENNNNINSMCLICLMEERNATIVHGETGHVACCLVCARILKARGDKCPVCRLNIDLVIQQFWA